MKRLSLTLFTLFISAGCSRFVEPKFALAPDLDSKVTPKVSRSSPEVDSGKAFALVPGEESKGVRGARGVYDGSQSSNYGWSNNLINIANSLFQYPSVKAVVTVLLRNSGYYNNQPYALDSFGYPGSYGGTCSRVALKMVGAAQDTLARISVNENELYYPSWQQQGYSSYGNDYRLPDQGKAQFVSWTRENNYTTVLTVELSKTEVEATIAYVSSAGATSRTLIATMTTSPCQLQRYNYTNSTVTATTTTTKNWNNLVQTTDQFGYGQYTSSSYQSSNYNTIASTGTPITRGDAQSIVKPEQNWSNYNQYSYYCTNFGIYCN